MEISNLKSMILSFLAILLLWTNIASASLMGGPQRVSKVEGTFSKPAHVEFQDSDLNQIHVPTGFKVTVFAKQMGHSRTMILGLNHEIYVSDPEAGEIYSLKKSDDGVLSDKKVIVSGIKKINGMILHDNKIYFVAVQKIYMVDLNALQIPPKVVVEGLPSGGQHSNRNIHEGPDGYLYVSLGSTCNTCDSPDTDSATLQKMKFDGTDRSTMAKGLRDTMAFDWDKQGRLFGVDNGVDWRGDNIPPEKLNLIRQDGNYGWPFCWGDKNPDPNLIDEPKGTTKQAYCKQTDSPALTFTAHSAPIDLKFYKGTQFPENYQGSAFISMHGSWNRSHPSGYRVLRVVFENGKAIQSEDFMTGFLAQNGSSAFGRPSGLLVDTDGSLLVSDDEDGIIYRISYVKK